MLYNNRPIIECNDGFRMSVQASPRHYCQPRNNEGPYESVEAHSPHYEEVLLAPYAVDSSLLTHACGWVPMYVIEQIIIKHGGLSAWCIERYTWQQPGLPAPFKDN
jgi:hypothetical protein